MFKINLICRRRAVGYQLVMPPVGCRRWPTDGADDGPPAVCYLGPPSLHLSLSRSLEGILKYPGQTLGNLQVKPCETPRDGAMLVFFPRGACPHPEPQSFLITFSNTGLFFLSLGWH